MGVRRVTGSGGAFPGSESLTRWQEWRIWPGYNVAAAGTIFGGFAFARHLPVAWNAGNPAPVWVALGNSTAVFQVITDTQVLDVFAVAAAIGLQECVHLFRSGLVTNGYGVDFTHQYPTALESALGVETRLAQVISFWMRKKAAGDATSAAQFAGIINFNGEINRSSRVARIGVMGDGALGFRFGSLNCPDAIANGGLDNVANAIDPGSVQPAVLINPGVNWFHVIIKLVPATEGASGRWGAYLDGRLVAVFTDAARMPRTSLSGIDVQGSAYWVLAPAFAAFGNGGAAPSPGYYLRDVRVWLDSNLAL